MADPDAELAGEITASRAELRMRADAHEREVHLAIPPDLTLVDVGSLTFPDAKALIDERYRHARHLVTRP